jgi:hypothetical protein
LIDTLTISIPVDLASYAVWQRSLCRKYETNQVIKALDTWLLLKNDTRSSWIQDWNKQKTWLLKLCKISESIFRHRLRVLSDLKLIRYDRTGIRLCSWNQLERTFEIATDRKFTIQYNLNDKQRIQEWLIATEIRENQSRQAYKVNQKLNKNPELYRVFTDAIINAGADRNKLNDRSYFLQWLKILYHEDFIKASKIHAELIEVRPDTNRSVKGMANAWCYKAPQSVSYWKGILQKSGIIDVDKLQIRSTDRVRNKHCRVLWLKKDLQTLLCLCDQILVLEPWTIQKLIAA